MGSDSSGPGIVPLAVIDLFDKMERNREKQCKVTVSFLEVYNETIRDLLVDPPQMMDDVEGATASKDKKVKVCSFIHHFLLLLGNIARHS